LQDGNHEPVLLIEQGKQEVGGSHLGITALGREPLRGCHGLLGLDRETVWLHRLQG
jgi:hypothetical protein